MEKKNKQNVSRLTDSDFRVNEEPSTAELKRSEELEAWINRLESHDTGGWETTDRVEQIALDLWQAAQDEAITATPHNRNAPIAEFPNVQGYEVIDFIGQGGMGAVFRARDLKLGRTVALKVLVDDKFSSERAKQRFQVEVQAAAQLDHPSIVTVYAFGEYENGLFYSMREVDGMDLARKLEEADASVAADEEQRIVGPPMNLRSRDYHRWVARVGHSIADALAHSHERLVIHRDVKPANIIVDQNGDAFLADFGLARLSEDSDLTGDQDVMGSLRYMSPEQIEGSHQVDQRSDVYSLGITLYELLVGKPAVNQQNLAATWQQVKEGRIPRPRSVNSSIESDLETIILKAISPETELRYASAGDLRDDLNRYLEVLPIHAKPPTVGLKLNRWVKRNKRWVAASGLIAGSLLAVIFVFAIYNSIRASRDGATIRARSAELLDQAGVAKIGNADGLLAIEDFQQASVLSASGFETNLQKQRIDGIRQWSPELQRVRDFEGRLIAIYENETEVTVQKVGEKSVCYFGDADNRMPLFSTTLTIQKATFSPDGNMCAVLAGDRTNNDPEIRIYNKTNGDLFLLSDTFKWRVTDLFFLKDNRSLFLTGWSGKAEIWDTNARKLIRSEVYNEKRKAWVYSATRNKSRSVFVAVVYPGHLVAYSIPSLKRLWDPIQLANWNVETLEVSENGKWVAAGTSTNGIRLWHVETGEEVELTNRPGTRPTAAAFSRDESHFAVGDHFGNVFVWKLSDSDEIAAEQRGMAMQHDFAIRSIRFNDRFHLAVATPNKVTVWRLQDNQKLTSALPVESGINNISWVAHDELGISTYGEKGDRFEYWKLPEHLNHEILGEGSIDQLLVNQSNISVFAKLNESKSYREAIQINNDFNPEQRPTEIARQYLTSKNVIHFLVSENRSRAITLQVADDNIWSAVSYSFPDMQPISDPIDLGYGPFSLDIDQLGERWILGGFEQKVVVGSTGTGETLFEYELPNWIKETRFLSDGGFAATCWDGKLRIWNRAGNLAHEFDHSFIPDQMKTLGGQLIVAHGNDLSLYQLENDSWSLTKCIPHNSGMVECVEISKDESRFVTCGDNGQTVLWSKDADRVATLGSAGPVASCAFAENSDWLATLGHAGGINLWECKSGKPMSTTIFGREPIKKIVWCKELLYFCGYSDGKHWIQKLKVPTSWR